MWVWMAALGKELHRSLAVGVLVVLSTQGRLAVPLMRRSDLLAVVPTLMLHGYRHPGNRFGGLF